MKHHLIKALLLIAMIISCLALTVQAQKTSNQPLKISGVYPHLAVFNEGNGIPCDGNANEGGIGAVVPWAGKLWMVTYSPHCPGGSSDKLYSIDQDLNLFIRPESVGGTPANRLIHRETNQLLIGPHLIDATGNVRTIPPSIMPGRLTATARHLTHPESMVYYYDMEGMLYEADVNKLTVNKLFHKPIPGWHGKGGYTGQGRLVVSNNGEHKVFDIKPELLQAGAAPKNADEMGVLASWDGKKWEIIERKQFTDVTGPDGIYGESSPENPIWSIGWDKRSVILKMLDHGTWLTYRLPKATNTYDHWGGWYTEWPRIREIGNNKMLMDMHGMFYDFPKTFSRKNTAGISPISTHLRYIPDFCNWNGQLVLATDETTILENPFAGRSQSNLWFGKPEDLKSWGSSNGWGGPWMNDTVKANIPSDAFLINGFEKKMVHLTHDAKKAVRFTLEIDKSGNNSWSKLATVTVDASGYAYCILPENVAAQWVRVKTDMDCKASAFFYFQGNVKSDASRGKIFESLLSIESSEKAVSPVIRPAKHNKNLQVLLSTPGENANEGTYLEVDEKLEYVIPAQSRQMEVAAICKLKKDFDVDEASVIAKDHSGTYRLPKTSAKYDAPFEAGWPRGLRELESERYMFNAHGTFYEVPREAGMSAMRPITTHKKQIQDFCTWRGLLVLSGIGNSAKPDGHYFENVDKKGLWFGAIDDLWKLGKPVGEGGVWKNSMVQAKEASLPYLMTGYGKKTLKLTSDTDATFSVEVDFANDGWHIYKQIKVPAGKTVTHVFPSGFNAHWVRLISDQTAKVTGWFVYE